jgi:hypothetical protein
MISKKQKYKKKIEKIENLLHETRQKTIKILLEIIKEIPEKKLEGKTFIVYDDNGDGSTISELSEKGCMYKINKFNFFNEFFDYTTLATRELIYLTEDLIELL